MPFTARPESQTQGTKGEKAMLTNYEITSKIHQLKEYEAMEEELKGLIESLKDELKSELISLNTEELTVSDNESSYIIRYTSVLSSRFDTKRFKEELGEELYKKYQKEVSSRRFTIA